MTRNRRLRRVAAVAVTAVAALVLAACAREYPNTTFEHTTEFNAAIDSLWDKMLFWGTLVFVIVESILIYTIVRFRRRPDSPEPRQVHGNTALEITWTVLPAVILVFIAIPTVRTIFRTQAKAVPNALQVEVIGHQWWWEFRYPQYGFITANELYLPAGRTVNFALRTADVIHSFWIPRLGGKRDLTWTHKHNYLWFTPDSSLGGNAFNGSCNEYCGASHANMKFRTFVVSPAEFESWAQHQAGTALGTGALAAPGAATTGPGTATPTGQPSAPATATPPAPAPATQSARSAQPAPAAGQPQVVPVAASSLAGFSFPVEQLPDHAIPKTPVPASLTFPDLTGDVARGRDLVTNVANLGKAPCLTCHVIKGAPQLIPDSLARGPNLTHFGSRVTLGAGLFPNDDAHLAKWIKNSRLMKPGIQMPTLGRGQVDPMTGQAIPANAGLTDQEIADITAYLRSLK
jgi:cytochrome c oxidase subunit 2